MKIKIPIKNIDREDICKKVEKTLRDDKMNAYTIQGLMVEAFDIKKEDMENKPFKDWKKGLPVMYRKISDCLRRLEKADKVKSGKHGKAFVYWYNE